MRNFLNYLYLLAGGLAACFMVAILVFELISILSRFFSVRVIGMHAYAGYSMAAAGFLSLAYTFKKNEHIRVTLLSNVLPKKPRRFMYLFALFIALGVTLALAWYSVLFVIDSFIFNDLSTDEDATPLWIPQLSMSIGTIIFLISIIDEIICVLTYSSSLDDITEMSYHE